MREEGRHVSGNDVTRLEKPRNMAAETGDRITVRWTGTGRIRDGFSPGRLPPKGPVKRREVIE